MHQPGDRVGGRYQLVRYLGGGFGQTHLAEDIHLPGNPPCAVKHLQPTVTDALSLDTAKRLIGSERQSTTPICKTCCSTANGSPWIRNPSPDAASLRL